MALDIPRTAGHFLDLGPIRLLTVGEGQGGAALLELYLGKQVEQPAFLLRSQVQLLGQARIGLRQTES